MKRLPWLAVVLLLALLTLLPARPGEAAPPVRSLDEFGPIDTPDRVRTTYEKAIRELRKNGGVLFISPAARVHLRELALQGLVREPAAPAETKTWRDGSGVTVLSGDAHHSILQVPPLSGLRIERNLRLDDGDSLPHWGTHPMLTIDSKLTYGAISYLDWIQEPVAKGKDRRFYLPTVRGIRPGQFLNIHGGPGYGGGVTRACVKSIGYDAAKKRHYLVADTDLDHVAGAIAHNKSNTGLLHMVQTSNNDNQTYDVKVIRNQYAHGDTYVYYCDFNYMSNVHSAAGDENGHCYSAFIRSMDNNFHGAVEAVDWKKQQLRFGAGRNVETLGDSRPLLNRNPNKAVGKGKVLIVPAECYHDPIDTGKCRFEGKTYPTRLIKNPVTGVSELKMGGLIRGDRDCPWTAEVVGRFFAVNTPEEKTPGGNLRWYEITAFKANPDGTKDIEIARFWWGAKSAGSPTLYQRASYSLDGHLRPLDYLIAPGAYVNDVSRAIPGGDRGGQQTLGLSPYRDQDTPLDFDKGDAIEQAIGPDPFKPQAFRVWMWEDVPGAWPSAVFDVANFGTVSRHSALAIRGGPETLEEAAKTKQQKPSWDNIIVVESAAGVGLNLKGDFSDAAILMQQPNKEQPIKWHYGRKEGQPPKEATLTVSRATGELTFQGGGVQAGGPVSGATGLSGDTKPARNLRAKNVAVPAKATSYRVKFAHPESDGDYAAFVDQSWVTGRAVTEKTADGFRINFATPAPEGATLDWMIVR